MTIRRVLAAVAVEDTHSAALDAAAVVARRFGAHLVAFCIQPDVLEQLNRAIHREGIRMEGPGVEGILAHAEQSVRHARARFETVMEKNGIPVGENAVPGRASAAWRSVPDLGGQALLRQAMLADLVVVGRRGSNREPSAEIVNGPLFTLAAPVLVAPSGALADIGKMVLIGWNPTVQAARAVMRSLPFLKEAREVRILSVATRAKEGADASEAASYLALHRVTATVKEIPPDHRGVGEVLLSEAAAFGADLLVMGAYSHSRLREMILGGVTRDILAKAELPVLMVH